MTGTQLELFPVTALDNEPRDYIEKDSYTGAHVTTLNRRKHRVSVWYAGDLAKHSRRGEFFESIGHVNGVEHFARTRYIADEAGKLHCYNTNGEKVITHPASRSLRILVGK